MSMGITQMNSILSSQNTLKSIETLNTTKTSMSGSARIMASEIKQDKGRGLNTAKKEEELADTKERIKSIGDSVANSITELNKRLEDDREKIREEEAEKADTSKIEQSVMVSNPDGTTEVVVTMEISPEAKAAAAADPVNVANVSTAATQTNTSSTGVVVDIKA